MGLCKIFLHLHQRTQATWSLLYHLKKRAIQITLARQIKSASLIKKIKNAVSFMP